MQDVKELEEAWGKAGQQLWEAEAEQDRIQHLYQLVNEGKKMFAALCLYYLVRQVLAERAVKNARKADTAARDALHAAQAPDEVPSAEAGSA